MENATKALFIVTGVLIGMMILSLGVALYLSLQGYISDTQDTMNQNATSAFNTQFLKYINMQLDNSGDIIGPGGKKYKEDFKLRIQDIITAANIAYQNNIEHNANLSSLSDTDYNENNLYVTINATFYFKDEYGNDDSVTIKHIETQVNEKASEWLSKYTLDYQYKCFNTDVKISEATGRVYEITFK